MTPTTGAGQRRDDHEDVLLLRQDLINQAKTISDLVMREAVRQEADKGREERFERIEKSLAAIYSLGKWVLGTAGAALIIALVGFVLKGGPLGGA